MQHKNLIFILLFLINCIINASEITAQETVTLEYNPILVVVLMVKNEAPVIKETLQPFIDAHIDSFLIFDTGSTDDTVAIVETFFKENDINHAYIEQEPFIDFATSRNRALQLARERFPQAAFLLMPDAEWYMHNTEGLLDFCKTHCHDKHNVYLVRILLNEQTDYYVPHLIRCNSSAHFVGAVHETINQPTRVKVPSNVYFEWRPSQYGIDKSYQRWQRDKDLLLASYIKNPYDARTVFYLAQTYECLGELENAYTFYKLRAELNGWDEENFITYYRLGNVTERLTHNNEEKYNWDLALHYYLEAFSIRPHRAEPLVKIAQHYLAIDNKVLCFLFARHAAELPYPNDDILFVEKDIYDYVRHDILGICAWYIDKFEIGEQAVRHALKTQPDIPHLHRNLALYLEHK